MESVMRSFSWRSRPARYSLRASSDEVVMAILPLLADPAGAEPVALPGLTCSHPATSNAETSRSKDAKGAELWFRIMGCTPFGYTKAVWDRRGDGGANAANEQTQLREQTQSREQTQFMEVG